LRFRGGIDTRDVALGGAAAHAVLVEATGRFTGAVETWDNLPLHVDHLTLGIDS